MLVFLTNLPKDMNLNSDHNAFEWYLKDSDDSEDSDNEDCSPEDIIFAVRGCLELGNIRAALKLLKNVPRAYLTLYAKHGSFWRLREESEKPPPLKDTLLSLFLTQTPAASPYSEEVRQIYREGVLAYLLGGIFANYSESPHLCSPGAIAASLDGTKLPCGDRTALARMLGSIVAHLNSFGEIHREHFVELVGGLKTKLLEGKGALCECLDLAASPARVAEAAYIAIASGDHAEAIELLLTISPEVLYRTCVKDRNPVKFGALHPTQPDTYETVVSSILFVLGEAIQKPNVAARLEEAGMSDAVGLVRALMSHAASLVGPRPRDAPILLGVWMPDEMAETPLVLYSEPAPKRQRVR